MNYTMSLLRERLLCIGFDASPIHGENAEFKHLRFNAKSAEKDNASLCITAIADDETLLRCDQSVFTVKGSAYSDVCGAVIDICQYFDTWEKDLHEMVWEHLDFQQMIDRTDEIFDNPIFICNWQGNVLGYSRAYKSVPIREFWRSITHDNHVPISSLAALMDSRYREFISQENQVHMLDFPELNYRSLFGLVHVHSEIALQFQIIEFNHPLTDADQSLAKIFLHTLRHAFREHQLASHEGALDVFKQLLEDAPVSSDSLAWALDYLGWSEKQNYYLIAFTSRDGSACSDALFPQIERHVPGCRMIEYHGNMTMLLPEGILLKFMRELRYVTDVFHLYAAISMPFSDWDTLHECYERAVDTLRYCTDKQPLCRCIDHAWDLMLKSLLDTPSSLQLIHPAIPVLAEYDRENGTDLTHSLYQYLACERSNVDTAAALFIHRNTLKYRLDKIRQLTDVDLNNLNTRLHLMISCQIAQSDSL